MSRALADLRPFSALLIPFAALAVQAAFWRWVQPEQYLFFYAAVVLSAWVGTVATGLAATGLSAVLAWYFFVSPRFTWGFASKSSVAALIAFVVMGAVFTLVLARLRRAEDRNRIMLGQVALTRDRERIARELHDTVIQHLFAAGMRLAATQADADLTSARRRAAQVSDDLDDVIESIRSTIFDLRDRSVDAGPAR